MKLVTSPHELPGRKHKTKHNPLEDNEAYLALRRMILDNKLKPHQQVGLFFGPDDQKNLGMKFPWRTAADRLRKMLKEHNLESDYSVVKFETDQKGVWFVRVTHTPPEVEVAPRRRHA